ncbi:hypothetical protein MASR2M29_08190 [Spirochaetota bacterium]
MKWAFTNYAPANYIGENAELKGYFVDIMKEAFARIGKELFIEVYPWLRCQAMLEAGLVDVLTTVPTAERLKYSISVDPPIWKAVYSVYALKSHPGRKLMDSIREPEDIEKYGFSVLTYSGHEFAKDTLGSKGVRLIETGSVEGMYKMLAAGRGDCIVEVVDLAKSNLIPLGYSEEILPTKGSIAGSTFNILISKKSAFVGLAPLLSQALKNMYEDGIIDRIMEKYK